MEGKKGLYFRIGENTLTVVQAISSWSVIGAGSTCDKRQTIVCLYSSVHVLFTLIFFLHSSPSPSSPPFLSLSPCLSLSQEMQQVEQAAMLLERASTYYHESGHGDTAGQVLTKAAK